MEKPKFRRKVSNYLILPGYQIRFLVLLVLIGMILILFEAVLFYLSAQALIETLTSETALDQSGKEILHASFRQLSTFILLDSTGVVIVCGLLGLFFSHRMAGPLYNIQRTISRISGGETAARITLRKGDQLQSLAQDFNEMMDKLTAK
jgi:methyl-accepting chemotaxis protein